MTPGEVLPELERTLDQVAVVAYAGATWDWHRMHHDQAWARDAGFDAPVVDGQVFGALLVELLQDGCGPSAFVTGLTFRFRSMVHVGQTVRCRGTCTDVTDGVATFDLEVVCGDRTAVTATGTVRT